MKDNKGIVGKRAVSPCQVKLYYDCQDLGKKIDGDQIDGDDIDHDHVDGDCGDGNHVDGDKAKKKALIELEQRYNTKCNIDTSPLLVEEMAQQE